MKGNIASTTLIDDPDFSDDGYDIYGMVPLFHAVEDDEEEGGKPEADLSAIMGAEEGEEGEAAEIEPDTREVEVEPDREDDDPAAYATLTSYPSNLTPGEAEALIDYMRPLSHEEEEIDEEPMLRRLRWVDDPLHTDDLLRAGKGKKGLDGRFADATYGDDMNDEERADRHDNDHLPPKGGKARQHDRLLIAKAQKEAKRAVVSGLHRKLVREHSNFLAAHDLSAGVELRPKPYYDNIARLWAKTVIVKERLPVSEEDVEFRDPVATFVRKANAALKGTESSRLIYDLADDGICDMSGWGWNPISAVRKAVGKTVGIAKGAVKTTLSTAESAAKYGYKYGVKMPAKYAYKGVKKVGEIAQNIALAPLKAIIRRFTGKMVGRRAAFLAKQRGLSAPGARENTEAKAWAKTFTRTHHPKYGGIIASLMGNEGREYGSYEVDISFGSQASDEMGISKGMAATLILLGPIGLAAVLAGLVRLSEGQAPPQEGETPEGAPEDAPPEEGAPDASYDSSAPADASATADYGDQSEGDMGAKRKAKRRKGGHEGQVKMMWGGYRNMTVAELLQKKFGKRGISIEKLQSMNPSLRIAAQRMIQSGQLRLA
jgi:hypothetical protein